MPRFLCDQAKAFLDAVQQKAGSLNMPQIDFGEKIPASQLGLGGPDDLLIRQLVVYSALVEVGGVPRPAVIFTGLGSDGAPLPKWVAVGTSDEMAMMKGLIVGRFDHALQAAQAGRDATREEGDG